MERTKYMQLLMTVTQSETLMEAIRGGFDGSQERAIAEKIRMDYLRDHSEACELMNFVCKDDPTLPICEAALKVAYLITSSKIYENV